MKTQMAKPEEMADTREWHLVDVGGGPPGRGAGGGHAEPGRADRAEGRAEEALPARRLPRRAEGDELRGPAGEEARGTAPTDDPGDAPADRPRGRSVAAGAGRGRA